MIVMLCLSYHVFVANELSHFENGKVDIKTARTMKPLTFNRYMNNHPYPLAWFYHEIRCNIHVLRAIPCNKNNHIHVYDARHHAFKLRWYLMWNDQQRQLARLKTSIVVTGQGMAPLGRIEKVIRYVAQPLTPSRLPGHMIRQREVLGPWGWSFESLYRC